MARFAALFAVVGLLAACSDYKTAGGNDPREMLEQNSRSTLAQFQERDPSLESFAQNAYGYVVFPEITKGAVGVGGAHGDGVVYEQGQVVGYAEVTQGTVGLQLGGQSYSQIIFFEDQYTLDHFKQGNLELSANASAVAAESGSAAAADFHEGLAVFTVSRGGLMFEASIGGQKFNYVPRRTTN